MKTYLKQNIKLDVVLTLSLDDVFVLQNEHVAVTFDFLLYVFKHYLIDHYFWNGCHLIMSAVSTKVLK